MDIIDVAARLNSRLAEQSLVQTERREYDWVFHFADEVTLRVACPWRILCDGRIALGDCDHAQQFGLPEPVDGAKQSDRLLRGETIQHVTIREDSGDLTIKFRGQTSLEVLNTSSGYEGWELEDGAGLHVIATGGGELALWTG
jgi:Family of unknown function (DUF6188)